jgi:hypothetical protein
MIATHLPDEYQIRTAPQRGALALLDAHLVVGEHALKAAHSGFVGLPHAEPRKCTIARLLVERFRELRCLLAAYEQLVINSSPAKDDDEDIPY